VDAGCASVCCGIGLLARGVEGSLDFGADEFWLQLSKKKLIRMKTAKGKEILFIA